MEIAAVEAQIQACEGQVTIKRYVGIDSAWIGKDMGGDIADETDEAMSRALCPQMHPRCTPGAPQVHPK